MKWIGWLAKWAAGAVLAAALSVLTTVYMVESYLDALLVRWNLGSVESPELDLGRLFSLGTGAWNSADAEEPAVGGHSAAESADGADELPKTGPARVPGGALKVDATPVPETPGSQGPPGTAGTGESGTVGRMGGQQMGGGKDESGAQSVPPQDALPVFGHLQSGLVMSAEEFNEKRKNLSEAEKMEIFTLLLNHVPQEELQRLSGYVEDGITVEEAEMIIDVMGGYLGPDEMDRLFAILAGE